MKQLSSQSGSSLIEVILVLALFSILSVGVLSTLVTSSQASKQGAEYVVAAGYIEEAIEATRSIRDQDWSLISNGSHGLSTAGAKYSYSGVSDSLDSGVYTRTTTIEDVYRTGSLNGDIAPAGVLDQNSKKVTVNVVWDTLSGKTQNISAVFYVYNWSLLSWTQDLTADFTAGTGNSTAITTTADGEVTLASHDADWDGFQTQYEIDLLGVGIRHVTHYDPQSDLLFMLTDDNGAEDEFIALDVADVTEGTPTIVHSYNISDGQDFVVANGFAYLAVDDVNSEVTILDISDFSLVATIDLEEDKAPTGIAVSGSTLIIVRQEGGDSAEVYYYNISNPASPSLLGSTEVGTELTGVVANDTYAFASSSDSSQELFAFNIASRTQVDVLDLANGSLVNDMDILGNNLYLGRKDGGEEDIYLLNVSDPSGAGMSVTSSLELGADVNGVAVDSGEDFLMLATNDSSEEAKIISLSSFTKTQGANTTGSDQGFSAEIFGGHAYMGSEADSRDLFVFNVSGGSGTPSLIGLANVSGNHNVRAIYVDGNYTYMGKANDGSNTEFFIYDTTTPSSPVLLGTFEIGDDVRDIVVSGNYAYLATDVNARELDIIDISNKAAPSREGSFNATGSRNGYAVTISGSTVYLGRDYHDGNHEFYAIDVSNPASPSSLGSYDFDDEINDLVVSGNYVYAATEDNSKELVVFDVTNPASISEHASYGLDGGHDATSVALSGTTLVIGRENNNSQEEFAVFDVSNPGSPTLLGEGEVGDDVRGVSFSDVNNIYLASDENNAEYQAWDISTPATPTESAVFDLNGDANAIFHNGTYAFMGTESDTLELQIIGQSSGLSDYVTEGTFTSQAFDSGSSSTSWSTFEWTESGTGDIVFRVRTASTEANLTSASWVGSAGTPVSTYSTSGSAMTTDPGASGTRWIQWKAYLTGDGSTTPVLEDVTIVYTQ